QAQALLDISGGLTDEQKMIAEYWADGPRSELPPGHWNLFAQYVSRRDHHGDREHGLERDVKLFFALTNAVSDGGCCAWDNKRAFNSVRPITAIRTLLGGQMVRAWAGPYQGTKLIDGATWFPYQPTTFPTPPFPEYSSGHSNFSAAGAEILKRFTHADRFGASVTLPAGSSRVEPGAVPRRDLMLSWSTFSQFGFNVTRSADGSVQGHFNCLMAGSSQFPGFTLMAVRGEVTRASIGASAASFDGVGMFLAPGVFDKSAATFHVEVTPGGPGVGTLHLTLL